MQAPLVETVGDDPLDDPSDRVPGDPQQAGDRGLGHLLRQPRDRVLEVASVLGAGPRPRNRSEVDTAVRTAQAAELALDHAAISAEIEMPPALHTPAVDASAELAATRAHAPPAAQPDGHDHPLRAKADVGHGRPGRRSIRLNAVWTRTLYSSAGG